MPTVLLPYQPIVLLNTISKLFEKVIGERMQFLMISNNFIHIYQLGGLKQKATSDAEVVLTHFIHMGWIKNCTTSMLAFNIIQFFPSLNYYLLSLILNKASFDTKVSTFFQNYLIGRKTKYLWNSFSSPFFNVDIGVGQEPALFLILSALYLSPIFHIFEKQLKNLKIPISTLSFVDDRLLIAQDNSMTISNVNLFYIYNIISNLLTKCGLTMEHEKTEVFYFSRLQGVFNLPSLDLTSIGESVLHPKTTWHYLGFIFDHKLLFHQYIDFYANKAISTIKCIKMLGNSLRGLNPNEKGHLYRCCTLLIAF